MEKRNTVCDVWFMRLALAHDGHRDRTWAVREARREFRRAGVTLEYLKWFRGPERESWFRGGLFTMSYSVGVLEKLIKGELV
jgi:hypothetical protein